MTPQQRRAWDVFTSTGVFWLCAAALVLYNVIGTRNLDVWSGTDFWEHLAAIDAFARNPLHPLNPYVAGAQPSHLFTPYHLMWGLVARLARTSAYALAPVMAIANTVLFAVGLRLAARRIAGDVRLALPLGLAMLFLWLDVYRWSGFHNFGLLPLTASFPYWCALPLAMITLGLVDEARPAGALGVSLRAVAVSAVFLVHPLSGSFLAVALVIRALSAPGLGASARVAQALPPIAGLALSLAWPYFPVLDAAEAAPRFAHQKFGGDWKVFYDASWWVLLPALLGVIYFAAALRRGSADWMTWTLVVCAALYLSNPYLARSALLARYVIYVALLLQWGIVRWIADDNARIIPRLARVAMFVLVLLAAARNQVQASLAWVGAPWSTMTHGAAGRGGNDAYVRRFRAYASYLSTHDVLMARQAESWILPAIVGCHVVVVHHSNPFMEDFDARLKAGALFFEASTPVAVQDSLIARYGVTRVLLEHGDEAKLSATARWPLLFQDDVYEIRAVPRDGH